MKVPNQTCHCVSQQVRYMDDLKTDLLPKLLENISISVWTKLLLDEGK